MIGLYVLNALQEEERDRIHRTCVLYIANEGEFYFGREKIALGDIASRVKQFRETEGSGQMLYVSSAYDVNHRRVIFIISLIREAGHERIGLPTELPHGDNPLGSIETAVLVSISRCDESQQSQVPVVVVGEDWTTGQRVSLNGRPMVLEEVPIELKHALDQWGEKVVYVNDAKHVRYGEMTGVLNAIKRAGAKEIRFEPECKSGKTTER